jgi:NADH:ubiquinone oxidoreductase subunit E
MDLARDFFARLLIGHSVVTERHEIEAAIHEYYLGHSKAALLFALHQVFEAVDQSAPFAAKGHEA